MKHDRVTIVTVTYNAEAVLEETILSVLSQTCDAVEYIIIDGASTDGTVNIIRRYEEKITYWVSEPDEGIYDAMNKAISKATGQWINFMNAGDTFFDADTVREVMRRKNDNSDMVYGNFQIKESGDIMKASDPSECIYHMPFSHQSLFVKTTLMKQHPYNTCYRLAADHDFIVKMYYQDRKFEYIDTTVSVFASGGFAQSNPLLMYIESIKILLAHQVPEDQIKRSWWYQNLSKEVLDSAYQNTLIPLLSQVTETSRYSLWKHPLKKLTAYKKLISLAQIIGNRL